MDPRLLGRFGEAEAAEYLRRKGWDIVGMNYRTRLGEVDPYRPEPAVCGLCGGKAPPGRPVCPGPGVRYPAEAAADCGGGPRMAPAEPHWPQPRFDVVEIYAPAGRMHPGLPSTMWRTLLN